MLQDRRRLPPPGPHYSTMNSRGEGGWHTHWRVGNEVVSNFSRHQGGKSSIGFSLSVALRQWTRSYGAVLGWDGWRMRTC
jgi:hypothetical protein